MDTPATQSAWHTFHKSPQAQQGCNHPSAIGSESGVPNPPGCRAPHRTSQPRHSRLLLSLRGYGRRLQEMFMLYVPVCCSSTVPLDLRHWCLSSLHAAENAPSRKAKESLMLVLLGSKPAQSRFRPLLSSVCPSFPVMWHRRPCSQNCGCAMRRRCKHHNQGLVAGEHHHEIGAVVLHFSEESPLSL